MVAISSVCTIEMKRIRLTLMAVLCLFSAHAQDVVGGDTPAVTASTAEGSDVEDTCVVTVSKPHEYVDLGLPSGIKWATCNVGADRPEDYGDYYAWGETETKDTYNWSTYKWCSDELWTGMTRYTCPDGKTSGIWYGGKGTFVGDNKTTLAPEDDVAHVKWGGKWRMPTSAELDELRDTDHCTWTWTTRGGKNGYLVTSKNNGNSIFLPAAGYRSDTALLLADSFGYCWSSSLYKGGSYDAYYLYFAPRLVVWGSYYRFYGQSVRPVCP